LHELAAQLSPIDTVPLFERIAPEVACDRSVESYRTCMATSVSTLIVAGRIATPLDRWQDRRITLPLLLADYTVSHGGSLDFDQDYTRPVGRQKGAAS
jgi:hypothetical protein